MKNKNSTDKSKSRFQDETKAKTNRKPQKGRRPSRNNGNDDYDSKSSRNRGGQFERGYSNDPAWWMKAGQLSKDAARFSTFNALGAPGPRISVTSGPYTPAGIARFDYIPYFGNIDSVVHPINAAAKLMYDTINSKNSRNTAYDPNDLMLYTIAVANAWAVHAVVQRIVGMYNTFSPTNRYWWTPVAKSMGITPLTVQHSVVEWRNLANLIALKLNMLSVPGSIAYYARTIFMPSAFYADDKTAKASIYYFMPAALFKYGYDTEAKGMLTLEKCPWYTGQDVTPASVESYFDNLTANLFNDTDVNLMCADVLKAYGVEGCFRLPQIGDDYSLSFVWDPVVNSQLHNATIMYNAAPRAWAAGEEGYRITQDMVDNSLTTNGWKPDLSSHDSPSQIYFSNEAITCSVPLDFYVDDPSETDFTEATRLTSYVVTGSYVQGCTEILVKDRYWIFESVDGNWTLTSYSNLVINGMYVDNNHFLAESSAKAFLHEEAVYGKIHDAPLHWVVLADPTNGYTLPKSVELASDLCNYTTVTKDELDALNRACQLSVFSPIAMG